MFSEAGTYHILGFCWFCLFCPFPPAAHPLITSSLGRQCNNRTEESGLFPFVLLSFGARQLRRAITPMVWPSHIRLTASQGSQAPRHEGTVSQAPGDRVPVLWKVGKAEPGELAYRAALCSTSLAFTEHLGSQLSCFSQAIISSGTIEFSPEMEAAPLLPLAHGMEAFRLVFTEFTQISPSSFPAPPSLHN